MDPESQFDELEELMRRTAPSPEPPRALRHRARKAFLQGAPEGSSAGAEAPSGEDAEVLAESTSRSQEESRTSERLDTRLEQKMAAQPIAPPANLDFRAQLRRTFVEGSWDELPAEEADEGPQGIAAEHATGDRIVPRPRRRQPAEAPGGRILRFVLPLAAAAAILFIALLPGDPRWDVKFEGGGTVRIDTVAFGPGDTQQLGALLSQGASLKAEEGTTLTLRLESGVEVRVLPGTELTMDRPDPDSRLYFRVDHGEIYVATHPDYEGKGINVVSDLGRVEIVGTAFGVMRYDDGFCVCVCEGIVKAHGDRNPASQWHEVEANYRYYVPASLEEDDFIEKQGKHPHFEDLREFTRNAFR